MADQFQLLLSTHIFVSMISSAVCNAVCALDDSALEAVARRFIRRCSITTSMCQIFMPAWSVVTLLLPFDWGAHGPNDSDPKSEICSVAAQLTQHTVIVWQNMHRVL